MEFMNLLANPGMPIYTQLHSVSLNWIGKIILWLTTVCGSVGVGIILFSLLLKLVTMPFDVFQRINMRKQNIKMKENQERMEKLQKQYANDKEKYNQKVMEMYRESGISMMSSCLPMILSLVIFIVAINAFNAFASYSNVKNYNTMVQAYNERMLEDCAELNEETLSYDEENNVYTVYDDGEYIYYTVKPMTTAEGDTVKNVLDEEGKVKADVREYIENNNNQEEKKYYLDWEKISTSEKYAEKIKGIEDKIRAEAAATGTLTDDVVERLVMDQAIKEIFVSPAQDSVVETYNKEVKKNTKFLWIKNVWAADASYKHPVLGYKSFSEEIVTRKSCSCKAGDKSILKLNAYSDEGYNNVTGKLTKPKSEPNGYFIMIALSIGTILLQQFISMRSQKEQNKYSSVDGQSGGQQKMMMIIMTGMFAVFSFLYSSAFSIYLVVSNLFSLVSMLVINKLVDVVTAKKAAPAMGNGDKILSGRAAAVQRSRNNANTDKKQNKKK